MKQRLKLKAIQIRRISQIFFLLMFTGLFLTARDPLQKTVPTDLLLRLDPLAAIAAIIAGRTIVATFWLALLIIILSFLLGRSFCGWACPLGSSLDITNRLIRPGKRRGIPNWKYALLIALLFLAVLGVQAVWLLDPLVIFCRSLTLVFYPLGVWGLGGLIGAGFSWGPTEGVANWLWGFFEGWLLPLKPLQMALLTSSLLVFMAIIAMEQFGRRYWCRVLCPLGAFLGLISHISPFGRKVSSECTSCTECSAACRMAAIEDDFISTHRAECVLCLECSELCPPAATTYTWGYQAGGQKTLDIGRRRTIGIVGATVLLGGIWRAELSDRSANGYCIRPPGAIPEDDFLDLCLRCQQCVKACSSTGGCLQPSGVETSWGAVWTPRAHMREGYCEYSCVLCGQVCPSGAIQPLGVAAKQKQVIGIAYINRSRCIPWAAGEDCIVCEEHCPTSPKAIQFRKGSVELTAELKENVKLPYVDRVECIGCGICEYKCPVYGESAIRVTREGEQRLSR